VTDGSWPRAPCATSPTRSQSSSGYAFTPPFSAAGFPRLILAGLEQRARELGYRELRLDTTIMQTGAQQLFAGAGYREVGRGQLAGVEVVYFAKSLT
jgi:hypothetical protein